MTEYKIVYDDESMQEDTIELELNRLSRDGWKPVNIACDRLYALVVLMVKE